MSDQAPQHPKRARNSYIFFATARSREIRQFYRQRGLIVSGAAISKQLAAEWHQLPLPQREIWEVMAEQDKVRFDREYDEYAKNLAKVTLASIPKPPANREVAASQSHDAKGQSDTQSNLHKMVSSAGSLGSSELTRRLFSINTEEKLPSSSVSSHVIGGNSNAKAKKLRSADQDKNDAGGSQAGTIPDARRSGSIADGASIPSQRTTPCGVPDPLAAFRAVERDHGAKES